MMGFTRLSSDIASLKLKVPMEDSSDNNQPDFWTVRYTAGKTPWDFGGVP